MVINPLSLSTLTLVAALAVFSACAPSVSRDRDRPSAEYDRETGRLQRLTFDSNADGRNDAVGIMDGTKITRIELDTNGNGTVDRWDFFDADRRLARVGLARRDDGVMDAVAVYGPGERLLQMEISTRRDGRFDRVEFFENGALARADEDTDGDGRVDKWETYRPNPLAGAAGEAASIVTAVAFDDTSSGRPTRRLVYGPDGTLARAEQVRADGTFANSQTDVK